MTELTNFISNNPLVSVIITGIVCITLVEIVKLITGKD